MKASPRISGEENSPLLQKVNSQMATRFDIMTIAFCVLVGDMSRGLFFPTIWLLVKKFGGRIEDQGVAVALFSFGRIITSPIFGLMSERLGFKPSLIISNCVIMLGCLIYMTATHLSVLFLAQLIIGFGCGTLGVTRSYIANVTMRANRTVHLAYLTSVQFAAFSVTPILGSVLASIGERNRFSIVGIVNVNEFTLPAIFFAISSLLCLIFVWRFIGEEGAVIGEPAHGTTNRYVPVQESEAASTMTHATSLTGTNAVELELVGKHSKNVTFSDELGRPVDRSVAEADDHSIQRETAYMLVGGCLMNVATKGTIGVFETLGSEYVSSMYGWSPLRTGGTFAACGTVGICFLLSFSHLTRLFGDYNLMLYGILAMILSCILLAVTQRTNEIIFYIAIALMYSIGYPIGHTALLGSFSKIMRHGKQGFVMGLFASAGSFARVVFPIIASKLTSLLSESSAFCLMAAVLSLSVVSLLKWKEQIEISTSSE